MTREQTGSSTYDYNVNLPLYTDLSFGPRVTDDPDLNNPHVAWLAEYTPILNLYVTFKQLTNSRIKYTESTNKYTRRIAKQDGLKVWLDRPLPGLIPTTVDADLNGDGLPEIVEIQAAYITATGSNIDEVRKLNEFGITSDVETLIESLKTAYQDIAVAKENPDLNPFGALIRELDALRTIDGAFWKAAESTDVFLWSDEKDYHVPNSVISTAVHTVGGLRKIDNKTRLVPLPSQAYNITLDDPTGIDPLVGPSIATTINLDKSLRYFEGQGWENRIFVTLTSILSPNPARVIQNILSNYTNLVVDTDSFDEVAPLVENYPCNFAQLTQADAFVLAETVAWESRCALIISSNVVKIKYLSKEPDSVLDITPADIVFKSLSMGFEQPSERLTHFRGQWFESYKSTSEVNPSQRSLNVSNNAQSRGYLLKNYLFQSLTDESCVRKTAQFWLNRNSNIWRTVTFRGSHKLTQLEIYDVITLSLNDTHLIAQDTKAVVTGIQNNIFNGTVTIQAMLPIKTGEQTVSPDFWLDDSLDIAPESKINNARLFQYDPTTDEKKKQLSDYIKHLTSWEEAIIKKGRIVEEGVNGTSDLYRVNIQSRGLFGTPSQASLNTYLLYPDEVMGIGDEVQVTRIGAYPMLTSLNRARKFYRVTAVYTNYLVCVLVKNPGTNPIDVDNSVVLHVAKPFHLVTNLFDGLTVTRPDIDGTLQQYTYGYFIRNIVPLLTQVYRTSTRASDGHVETQYVVPEYALGDIIDVEAVESTGVVDVNGKELTHEDSNKSNARSWAYSPYPSV